MNDHTRTATMRCTSFGFHVDFGMDLVSSRHRIYSTTRHVRSEKRRSRLLSRCAFSPCHAIKEIRGSGPGSSVPTRYGYESSKHLSLGWPSSYTARPEPVLCISPPELHTGSRAIPLVVVPFYLVDCFLGETTSPRVCDVFRVTDALPSKENGKPHLF